MTVDGGSIPPIDAKFINNLILCKMTKQNGYDEAGVIRVLSAKQSIRIDPSRKVIEVLKNPTDLGNGSWGKIGFLEKILNYHVTRVDKIVKTHVVKPRKSKPNPKAVKNEFSMVQMTKAAMNKAKNDARKSKPKR